MGLIPQVKCGRCDRSYSGLRSRCPYCGAHRHKKGKRVTDSDNATWKLIIGALLIVVLIAAVIVILVTGSGDAEPEPEKDKLPGSNVQDGVETTPGTTGDGETDPAGTPGGEGDTEPDPGTVPEPEPEPEPDPTLPATVVATGLSAKTRYHELVGDWNEFTVKIAETVEVTAVVTPSNATSAPQWSSSDESVVSVVASDATGLKARVTGISRGTVTITVTVDDQTFEFMVRCNGQT